MMLSQTYSARFSHKAVALNGHLVKLGEFDDIKGKYSDESDEVSVHFCIEDNNSNDKIENIKSINVNFSFGFKNNISKLTVDRLDPPLTRVSVSSSFNQTLFGDEEKNINISVSKIEEPNRVHPFLEKVYGSDILDYKIDHIDKIISRKIEKEYPNCEIIGCKLTNFIPTALLIKYDHSIKSISLIISLLSDGNKNLSFKNQLENSLLESTIPINIFKKIYNSLNKERESFINFLKENIMESRSISFSTDEVRKIAQDSLKGIGIGDDLNFIKDIIEDDKNILVKDWLTLYKKIDSKHQLKLKSIITENIDEFYEILSLSESKDFRYQLYRVEEFSAIARQLGIQLSNGIKFLGPLRNEPMAVYPISGLFDPDDVGLKGENVAAVLHINKSREVQCPLPEFFNENDFYGVDFSLIPSTQVTIADACISWLSYMGVVSNISTLDKGKLGYELQVKTNESDSFQDLTHVGVGVSQVLPIVLMCLLSKVNETLIFEQPELHLHPKVQARLADFFIAMSSIGRQCIVETHSEYMINRLRYRVACSTNNHINDMLSLYFVNKINSVSQFEEIKISNFGAIKEWPDDFFDQTQDEVSKILRVASHKKKMMKMGSSI